MPIWISAGPMARGSGTPPSRPSVGQRTGQSPTTDGDTDGSMAISPESVWSSGLPPGPVSAMVSERA